jgi:hypothetical protein
MNPLSFITFFTIVELASMILLPVGYRGGRPAFKMNTVPLAKWPPEALPKQQVDPPHCPVFDLNRHVWISPDRQPIAGR